MTQEIVDSQAEKRVGSDSGWWIDRRSVLARQGYFQGVEEKQNHSRACSSRFRLSQGCMEQVTKGDMQDSANEEKTSGLLC
jgi:hypothetical protein